MTRFVQTGGARFRPALHFTTEGAKKVGVQIGYSDHGGQRQAGHQRDVPIQRRRVHNDTRRAQRPEEPPIRIEIGHGAHRQCGMISSANQ